MEWNFLFRIDHLNETGEERNLKGLLFTADEQPPTVEAIQGFLKTCGYQVEVEDPQQLVFKDPNPEDPVEIRIVRLDDEQEEKTDMIVRKIAEQFQKRKGW
ncbi:hypothetical protein [Marinicrinis sediminis]|uniref:Uncharacterized protein n=1 Tax=Marinicrinis sediminis TaxID=1652465 RepID=A0ABW5RE12_9BACL